MSDKVEIIEHAMSLQSTAQEFVENLMSHAKTDDQRQTVTAVKAIIDAQSEVIRALVEYNLMIIDSVEASVDEMIVAVEAEIEKQEKKSRSTWKNVKE